MISTKRLTLRPVVEADWRAIQAIWETQTRSPYACYDNPKNLNDDAVQEKAHRWAAMNRGEGHRFFAVCLEDAMIGYIALHRRELGHEFGYCFHSGYHRRGCAREALSALMEACGAKGVHRFIARTALNNVPSVRLLASLGFRLIGTERVSFYRDEAGQDIFFDGGIYARDA